MSISFACSSCGKSYTVQDHLGGRSARCKQCNQVNVIPKPDGADDAAAIQQAPPTGAVQKPKPETEERPAQPAAKSSSLIYWYWLIGGACAAVLVVCAGCLGVFFVVGSRTVSSVAARGSPFEVADAALTPDQRGKPQPADDSKTATSPAATPGPTTTTNPSKADSGPSLLGEMSELDELNIAPLKVASLPCMVWADQEGTAFFAIDSNGVLQRISFPGFKVVKEKDFERHCNWLSSSAEGLLLSMPDPQEIWILDPATLEVKDKIGVPGLKRAVSGPAVPYAFVSDGGGPRNGRCYVVDLKNKKVAKFNPPMDARFSGYDDPVMSPDGKYVFTRGGLENMNRFAFKDGKLRYEETSARIAQGPAPGIIVSPDSMMVCLPCGGGNYGAGNYSVFVYPTNSFKKTECILQQGAYPRCVGFDPGGGYIYAQNHSASFILFGATGVKKKEYKVPARGNVLQYLAHPAGNKVVLLCDQQSYYVEVPKKKN